MYGLIHACAPTVLKLTYVAEISQAELEAFVEEHPIDDLPHVLVTQACAPKAVIDKVAAY